MDSNDEPAAIRTEMESIINEAADMGFLLIQTGSTLMTSLVLLWNRVRKVLWLPNKHSLP